MRRNGLENKNFYQREPTSHKERQRKSHGIVQFTLEIATFVFSPNKHSYLSSTPGFYVEDNSGISFNPNYFFYNIYNSDNI